MPRGLSTRPAAHFHNSDKFTSMTRNSYSIQDMMKTEPWQPGDRIAYAMNIVGLHAEKEPDRRFLGREFVMTIVFPAVGVAIVTALIVAIGALAKSAGMI